MLLIFVFVVVFADAPPILTGMDTREQCEIRQAAVESEVRKLGKDAHITKCEPLLVRRPDNV